MLNHTVNKIVKRIIFISDIHLDPNQPEITNQFTYLLKHLKVEHDALYILGDLFEQWIGDDDDNEFTQTIIKALHETTERGVTVYITLGNRDFLLGKHFFKSTGCILLSDETVIDAFGTPVLLMHGDTLCTQDKGYQFFRALTHNVIFNFIYTSLSLKLRRYIADTTRNQSKQHTKTKSAEIMDVTESEVIKVMRKYGVNYLIHGHTHKPYIHRLTDQADTLTRIVLAAWHNIGSAYVWESSRSDMVEPIQLLFNHHAQ